MRHLKISSIEDLKNPKIGKLIKAALKDRAVNLSK
jgi:hypothetical protein